MPNTDLGIVGDRLYGATTRLMGALHAESIAEKQMDEAEPEMVPVYEDAITKMREQTTDAWHDCIRALGDWTALRSATIPGTSKGGA